MFEIIGEIPENPSEKPVMQNRSTRDAIYNETRTKSNSRVKQDGNYRNWAKVNQSF